MTPTQMMERLKEGRAFDWRRHHKESPQFQIASQMARTRGFDSRAFDAAGSSGMGFLVSSLEQIEPKLVEPLQAVTHARDLPMRLGGGFPEQVTAWASNYASSGTGIQALAGTNNTDIPQAQADLEKGTWPTWNWNQGFTVTYIDLERWKFAKKAGNAPPFTIQQLYEKSVRTVWNKDLDTDAYLGFPGNPGLINNNNVPAAVAINGAAGSPLWAKKTPVEIFNDINFGINQTVINSGYDVENGCANTLLVPYTQFALLTQPVTIGGVGYDSLISYIRRNCVGAQYFNDEKWFNAYPLPNPWISGQGIGNTAAQNALGTGTDRAVFYRKNEDDILLMVPTVMEPAMTIPVKEGPGYFTAFVGNIASLMWKRTTTTFYLDNV